MKIILSLTLAFCFITLYNCSSHYQLQKQSPLKFHKIEVQEWATNNQTGDSGIKMYIILPSDIETPLDSAFYDNLKTNIYKGKNKNTYFANFKTDRNTGLNRKFPFSLNYNECVVSYSENGKTKYYKYSGVKVKS